MLFDRQIALVPRMCQHEAPLIIVGVFYHLIYPVLHCAKRLLISQIVADDRADRVPIVQLDHGAELLRAARIPNVQLHLCFRYRLARFGARRHTNCLLQVGASNCHIVNVVKLVVAKPLSYGALSDARLAKQHDFTLHLAAFFLSPIRGARHVEIAFQRFALLLLLFASAPAAAAPLFLSHYYFNFTEIV